jgi:hypothetical protein
MSEVDTEEGNHILIGSNIDVKKFIKTKDIFFSFKRHGGMSRY